MTKKLKINKPYINSLVNKFFYCGLTFIANAFLTRALGVNLKGNYTWILSVANIASIIGGLGIYQSIPYYYRNKRNKDILQEYVDIFFLVNLIYSLISIIIILFMSDKITMLLICSLAILDNLNQQMNMLLLIDKIYSRNRIFLLGSVVNLILCIWCYLSFKNNMYIAVIMTIFTKIFYIISYLIVTERIPHPFQVKADNLFAKIKFGFLPMLSFLMITLNYRVDVIMLKSFKNVTDVALSYYTVGVSIAEIAWIIPDVFKEVLFSRTSDKKNDNEVSSALRVSNLIILISILMVIIFGRLAIIILYGKEFSEAYFVTIILFLGIPAMSWFKMIYTLFNAQGKRKTSFIILLASTLLNIIINAVTIPFVGIYGAAIASVISYTVCGIVFLYIYSKDNALSFWSLFIIKKNDIKNLIK